MPSGDFRRAEIVGNAMIDLVEYGVASAPRQGLEEGWIRADGPVSRQDDNGRCRWRDDAAGAVRRHGNGGGRQNLPDDNAPIEDGPSPPNRDNIAWQADHSLDEIRVFTRMPEDDDVTALGNAAQDASVERRLSERKTVTREAVRPFGNDQIVTDV